MRTLMLVVCALAACGKSTDKSAAGGSGSAPGSAVAVAVVLVDAAPASGSGSGSGSGSAAVPADFPGVDVIVASQTAVRFLSITAKGTAETRKVDVPGGDIRALEFVGARPVVLAVTGAVPTAGFITAAGFEALAMPPQTAKPSPDVIWELEATPTEAWITDGKTHYRLSPAPAVTAKAAPAGAHHLLNPDAPKGVTAPSQPVVALVTDPAQPKRKFLRCTAGAAKPVEFSPADARSPTWRGVTDLAWISATPPTFSALSDDECDNGGCMIKKTFENCTYLDGDYDQTHALAGPHDVLGFHGNNLFKLRWHGHEIASLAGPESSFYAFAP